MEDDVIGIDRSEGSGYKIRIDGQGYTLQAPEPTGGELLALIGRDPDRFVIALQLPQEPDRLVAFDETIDVTAPGVEEFALISKERYYSFRIDEQPFSITEPMPTGRTLLKLVGKAPETHLLNLNLPYQDDELIGADELVDLRKPGREQFSVTVRDDVSITIIVNGRKKVVTKTALSFEEVVSLGFDTPPTGQNIVFTVTYRRGVDSKPEGTLSSGETIKIREGMIFNVTATDKS